MLFASLFKSRRRSTVAEFTGSFSPTIVAADGDEAQHNNKEQHSAAAAGHYHSSSHPHSHPNTHHNSNNNNNHNHSRQSQPHIITTSTTTTTQTNYGSNRAVTTRRYQKDPFTMGVCFGSSKLGAVLAFLLSLLLVVLFGYLTFDIWRRDDGQLLQSWDNFKRSLSKSPFYGTQFIILLTFAVASLVLSIILLLGIIKRRPSYMLVWAVIWSLVVLWLVCLVLLLGYEAALRYGPDGTHRHDSGTEKFWTFIIQLGAVFVVTLLAIWALLGVLAFRNDLKFSRQEEYVQVATVG